MVSGLGAENHIQLSGCQVVGWSTEDLPASRGAAPPPPARVVSGYLQLSQPGLAPPLPGGRGTSCTCLGFSGGAGEEATPGSF